MTPEEGAREVAENIMHTLTDVTREWPRGESEVDVVARYVRAAVEAERERCHDILIREADRHAEMARNETLSRDRAIISEERARVLIQVADDYLRARGGSDDRA